MKKLLILVIGVLLISNLTFAQTAKDNFPLKQAGKGICKMLNLTPDQEKKFNDLTYQHQQQAIDIRAKIESNRLELKKTFDEGSIDEKKVLQLTDENSKLQGDLKNSATKRWLEVYKLLNDEQKALWTKHLGRIANRQVIKNRMGCGDCQFMREGKMPMNGRGMMRMHRKF